MNSFFIGKMKIQLFTFVKEFCAAVQPFIPPLPAGVIRQSEAHFFGFYLHPLQFVQTLIEVHLFFFYNFSLTLKIH